MFFFVNQAYFVVLGDYFRSNFFRFALGRPDRRVSYSLQFALTGYLRQFEERFDNHFQVSDSLFNNWLPRRTNLANDLQKLIVLFGFHSLLLLELEPNRLLVELLKTVRLPFH